MVGPGLKAAIKACLKRRNHDDPNTNCFAPSPRPPFAAALGPPLGGEGEEDFQSMIVPS
jgi:hypothetical protein